MQTTTSTAAPAPAMPLVRYRAISAAVLRLGTFPVLRALALANKALLALGDTPAEPELAMLVVLLQRAAREEAAHAGSKAALLASFMAHQQANSPARNATLDANLSPERILSGLRD